FGSEEQARAIEVIAELHAVGSDLADPGEAEDLEPAAIREDRQRPVHELVKAAGGGDHFESGPDGEMVRVAKDDLRAGLEEFTRIERLYRGLCANRHEHRGVDAPVRSLQAPEARPCCRVPRKKFKHRHQKMSSPGGGGPL